MKNQMHKYTDEELKKQKEALTTWIRCALQGGASPTLMEQALSMVEEEISRRKKNESSKM